MRFVALRLLDRFPPLTHRSPPNSSSRQFTKNFVRDHNLSGDIGVVVMAGRIAGFCFRGRLLAGSATTVGQALLFEACGLITELSVADQLLQGQTPLIAQRVCFYNMCCKMCGRRKSDEAVTPDDHTDGGQEEEGEKVSVR